MLVSGTYVAKHVKAATVGESRSKFSSEMFKGMRFASDTELWLFLLHEGEWLDQKQYDSINEDCVEMIRLTASIAKTTSDE